MPILRHRRGFDSGAKLNLRGAASFCPAMKHHSFLFGRPTLFVAALTLPLLGGCRLFFPTMGAPLPTMPKPQNVALPWQVTASANKTRFKKGETVELNISVRNATQAPLTLDFTSGQSFDFQATRVGETDTAWTWSADKSFIMALRQQTIQAGQRQSWKAQWPAPAPGVYRVVGSVTTNPALQAKPFEIVVK